MIRHEQEMYNGVKIPSLGYGCWKAPQAVSYTHLDVYKRQYESHASL